MTTGKVLKERRAPRERGRTGSTSPTPPVSGRSGRPANRCACGANSLRMFPAMLRLYTVPKKPSCNASSHAFRSKGLHIATAPESFAAFAFLAEKIRQDVRAQAVSPVKR